MKKVIGRIFKTLLLLIFAVAVGKITMDLIDMLKPTPKKKYIPIFTDENRL